MSNTLPVLRASACSLKGTKATNQDACLYDVRMIAGDRREPSFSDVWDMPADRMRVFAVCDGMGGLRGGEKASETLVKALKKSKHQFSKSDIPSAYWLRLNEKVRSCIKGRCGTTMVLAAVKAIDGERVEADFYSIGDSLICVLSGNNLIHVNELDNMAFDMAEAEGVTELAMEKASRQLKDYMGKDYDGYVPVHDYHLELSRGDIIILASDGMGHLTGEDMADIILGYERFPSLAAGMGMTALCKADAEEKCDNITVLTVEVL